MTVKPSPNRRPIITEQMRQQAAALVVGRMVKQRMIEKAEVVQSVADIVKVTRRHTDDGFMIARELEQTCQWTCDMEFAEELDQFGAYLQDIYDEAETKWAMENPREPTFSDGDTVVWRGEPATIHGVSELRPQCYKVRQGQMSGPDSYYIVPFESVSPQ